MKTLRDFKRLTDTEDFFEFFDLEYDERVVNSKRFHILKLFAQEMAKIDTLNVEESMILEFYKFSLIKVYMSFKENGDFISAFDVWNMGDKNTPCLSCNTFGNCNEESKNVIGNCGQIHNQFN